MKHNKLKSTLCFIVDCLAQQHYAPLYATSHLHPTSHELPLLYLRQALEEYGGVVTVAPQQHYRVDVIRQVDLPGKLFVDLRLWLDYQESDLTLQCIVYPEEVFVIWKSIKKCGAPRQFS